MFFSYSQGWKFCRILGGDMWLSFRRDWELIWSCVSYLQLVYSQRERAITYVSFATTLFSMDKVITEKRHNFSLWLYIYVQFTLFIILSVPSSLNKEWNFKIYVVIFHNINERLHFVMHKLIFTHSHNHLQNSRSCNNKPKYW